MKPDYVTKRQEDLWRAGALAVPLIHAASRCSWVTVLVIGAVAGFANWILPKYLKTPGKSLALVQRIWICVVIAEILQWNAGCWPSHNRPHGASLILLVLAAWTASRGKGANAGIGCVLLWPVALLLGAVFASALPEARIERLFPQWSMPDAWLIVICLLPLIRRDQKTAIKGKRIAEGIVIALVASAIVSSVLSVRVSRESEVPVCELSRSVGMLGAGVRMESLTAVAMTLGYYAAVSYLLGISADEGKCKTQVWIYGGLSAGAYLTGIIRDSGIAAIGCILLWVILPVLEEIKNICLKTQKPLDK